MPKLSSGLETIVNAQIDQIGHANAIKTALGGSRRLKAYRDPALNAVDPVTTGVKFLDVGVTGEMVIQGGKIVSFGATTGVTTKLSADLSTGTCVIVIEGNGHSIAYTAGLKGSGKEYEFKNNPTAGAHVGLSVRNMKMKAPSLLASGTGYPAPSLTGLAPTHVVIEQWASSSYVAEAGRIHFNLRDKNFVFADAEIAQNMGDIRVTKSTEKVTYGNHDFGAILLSSDSRVGTVDGVTLHDVLVNFKPTEANWANYPRAGAGNYIVGVSDTFMATFKVKVYSDTTLLGTLDMPKDNLPINSDLLSDVPTKTKAIRPHTHCASVLHWSSHEPKMNSLAHKYYPGAGAEYLRPTLMKERAATNGVYPMLIVAQSQGSNSIAQWNGMGKWAFPCDSAAVDADASARANDPYLWDIGPSVQNAWSTPPWATAYNVPVEDYSSLNYGMALVMGWGYEPGSYCGHDQYSGPGGVRFDRGVIPTPIAIHMSNPNWIHLRDNTPVSTMVKEWNKGYFNHPVHFFDGDIRNWNSVPTDEVINGMWTHGNTYYGANDFYTDINHTISLKAIANGPYADPDKPHWGAYVDANGRMPWNGAAHDFFHNYQCPGWAVMLYSSAAHIVSQKHRYLSHIMCQLTRSDASTEHAAHMVRDEAWYFFQEAMMWKLASDHPTLGVPRESVEFRIQQLLTGLYTNKYVPIYEQNSQTMDARGFRNLGLTVYFGGYGVWQTGSFALHYYMGHALQLWRQTGLWKVMWDRSEANQKTMKMILRHLDLGSIDYYLDTNGSFRGPVYGSAIDLWVSGRDVNLQSSEIASSWADWQNRVHGNPQGNLVTNADGSPSGADIGEFSKMQWPFIRRDYFPDIPCERDVNAACALVTEWQNTVAARVAGAVAVAPRNGTLTDWSGHAGIGRILPPTTLEP